MYMYMVISHHSFKYLVMDIWVCYEDIRELILVCDSAVAHPG